MTLGPTFYTSSPTPKSFRYVEYVLVSPLRLFAFASLTGGILCLILAAGF